MESPAVKKSRRGVLAALAILLAAIGLVALVVELRSTHTPATLADPLTPAEQAALEAAFDGKNESVTNSIGMQFRLIPSGTFRMGSDSGSSREKPPHRVTISRAFYLGACEVTQAQYESVMGTNLSVFPGPNRPAEQVSWADAQAFCRKLSQLEGVAYRLPTEAEWEYACRAGSATAYCYGDSASRVGEYAWVRDNSDRETHDVAQKKPNAWGLYDMHGNVWEWCQDWYGGYEAGAQTDPAGPSGARSRVIRGGSWDYIADNCRSAYRSYCTPPLRFSDSGFRVASPLPPESSSPSRPVSPEAAGPVP